MAPARPGQLDEISERLGELKGSFSSIERYMHEREHGLNNLAQKVDGLGTQITREVTRMKAELQVQLDAMDRRIATLEQDGARQTGAKMLGVWLVQTIVAAVAAVSAILALGKHP